MLVTNGDALVIEADDTRIGDGDTEDIAREVFQYGLLALSPDRAMDDPWPGPTRPRAKPSRDSASRTRA